MARTGDAAAYAANWHRVLLADAVLAVVVAAAGLGVLAAVSVIPGAGLAALGLAYLVAVGRRWRRWARLRADAGL